MSAMASRAAVNGITKTAATRARKAVEWTLVLVVAGGCGPADPEPGGSPAQRPEQPGATAGAEQPVPIEGPAAAPRAELSETAVGSPVEPNVDWDERLIAPSVITKPQAPAVRLRGRTFADGEHFVIRRVPKGVTFHRVGDTPATWEVCDAEGKRLALVQEESWSENMEPEPGKDTTAPVRAKAVGKETIEVEDWGGSPATVRAEQILKNRRLYRFERRAEGTGWLVKNFRYKPMRVGVSQP